MGHDAESAVGGMLVGRRLKWRARRWASDEEADVAVGEGGPAVVEAPVQTPASTALDFTHFALWTHEQFRRPPSP